MKNLEIKKLKIKINNLGLRVPITSFYKKQWGWFTSLEIFKTKFNLKNIMKMP